MGDDYTAFLARIDAAVSANLCGCGCGQQIPASGPSPDFVNEKHQQVWAERGYRASGGKVDSHLFAMMRQTTDDLYNAAWDAIPPFTIRRGGIRFPEPDACTDCDDLHCPCHNPPLRAVDPDETPMARVVRETSSLRRAIDKIMGKGR